MFNYSEKEVKLLTRYLTTELVNSCNAVSVYSLAVEEAFIKNNNDCYAESLRRCKKALNECKIYRMTKEFDDLIVLE